MSLSPVTFTIITTIPRSPYRARLECRPAIGLGQGSGLAILSLRWAWLSLEPAFPACLTQEGVVPYTGRGGALNTPSKDANGSQYPTWGLGFLGCPGRDSILPKVERGPCLSCRVLCHPGSGKSQPCPVSKVAVGRQAGWKASLIIMLSFSCSSSVSTVYCKWF